VDKKFKVVELFSGIGAQSNALERIKKPYEVVFTCEWDIRATIYQKMKLKNYA